MPRIHYNRRLNEKPRIFRFFTFWEFTLLLFVLVIPTVVQNILNLPANFTDSLVLLVLFTAFIIRFKLGRPEGYFPHWVKRLFTSRHFRPGHIHFPCPIDYPPSDVPTKDDLAMVELKLYELYGLVYVAPGKAVSSEYLPEEFLKQYVADLRAGNPLSVRP